MITTYDDRNIFAKILLGEAHCVKVHETELAMAFMDIMPLAAGHVLVIPKSPARNIFDISPAALSSVMMLVQKISQAQMKSLGADGIDIQQSNESAAGQIIFHMHVHVIPRFNGIPLHQPTSTLADKTSLETIAATIASAIL